MIFNDKINEIEQKLSPEVNRLLELAFKNQKHPGDLLLLSENGFYDEDLLHHNNLTVKLSPYRIGPNYTYFSEQDQFTFIDKYRTTNIVRPTHKEYLKELVYSLEKSKKIDEIIEVEKLTINIEMMIYLKIWETDLFIKRLYQFVRILHGECYDWNFKIAEKSQNKQYSSGLRHEIIREKIRDRLKEISAPIYNLIKTTYIPQLRNSIAHSNFSFHERNIRLNNSIKNDKYAKLESKTFDDWINIFHSTLILHNEYIGILNTINTRYVEKALKNGNTIPVKTTDKNGEQEEFFLEYKSDIEAWVFKQY